MHTIGCTTPDIAVLIDAHAIAVARLYLMKDITAGERRSVGIDVEDANILVRVFRCLVASLGYGAPSG
jgi:hypothetical protein